MTGILERGDKKFQLRDLDRHFIAAAASNGEEKKAENAIDRTGGRGLVRNQFLEVLVRIANDKYKGENLNSVDAFQRLVEENLVEA